MLRKCIALMSFAAVALGGCISDPVTSWVVSTAGAGLDASKTHVVAPASDALGNDPRFSVTAEMTRWALRGAGLQVLSANEPRSGTEPVVTVAFTAEPTIVTRYTTQNPIYSAPPSFTSRTVERIDSKGRKITETTYDPPTSAALMEAGIVSSSTVEKVNKSGERITETTYIPNRTIVGYEDVPHTNSRTPLHLVLKSFDAAALAGPSGLAKPLWTVNVDMTDGGLNPEVNLPYMLRAAQLYLGRAESKFVFTPVKDPGVLFIQSGGRKGKAGNGRTDEPPKQNPQTRIAGAR